MVGAPGGPVVMLAHGFGCDQAMWRFVAPAFAGDYRVVLFDYVGCGQSDLSQYDAVRYSSLDGYATDLIEVAGEFNDAPLVLVGHSVSAMIGLLADKRVPGIFDAHVMIGPSPSYIDEGDYVSAESHVTCGVCFHCRTGKAHMCEQTRILGVDRDGLRAEGDDQPVQAFVEDPGRLRGRCEVPGGAVEQVGASGLDASRLRAGDWVAADEALVGDSRG